MQASLINQLNELGPVIKSSEVVSLITCMYCTTLSVIIASHSVRNAVIAYEVLRSLQIYPVGLRFFFFLPDFWGGGTTMQGMKMGPAPPMTNLSRIRNEDLEGKISEEELKSLLSNYRYLLVHGT